MTFQKQAETYANEIRGIQTDFALAGEKARVDRAKLDSDNFFLIQLLERTLQTYCADFGHNCEDLKRWKIVPRGVEVPCFEHGWYDLLVPFEFFENYDLACADKREKESYTVDQQVFQKDLAEFNRIKKLYDL